MASFLSSTDTVPEERLLISNLRFSDRNNPYLRPRQGYLKPADFSSNNTSRGNPAAHGIVHSRIRITGGRRCPLPGPARVHCLR
jgi:hypothetical protein